MSIEDNKQLVNRYYEDVDNKRNFDLIYELVAADDVQHFQHEDVRGVERIVQGNTQFHKLFDVHQTVEDIFAEGDRVALRYTVTCVYKGGDPNLPASSIGKRVTVMGIGIYRIANDRIAEEWAVWDNLSWQQQLGMLPNPNQATS